MVSKKIQEQILGGVLRDCKTALVGVYRGYYLVINLVNGQYVIRINAKLEEDVNNAVLAQHLQQMKVSDNRILGIQAYPNCIDLTIKTPNLAKNIPGTLNEIVESVIQYLMNCQYSSGCELCGNNYEDPECYEINGEYHYLCNECKDNVGNSLRENQENIKRQKSNLAAGLVGAFLGSLIGCILWVVIYKLGYIAGIAGAVTGICAMKGYELLGKHLDKKGVIGSVIIMVVMIYFANKLAWTWDAYDAFKSTYDVTFSEIYQEIGAIIQESDLTGSYYTDLIIGYFLTILCSIKNIIGAFRASTGSYTMKKVK